MTETQWEPKAVADLKQGDHIKAVLGPSVIVGTVYNSHTKYTKIVLIGAADLNWLDHRDGWEFFAPKPEIVRPEAGWYTVSGLAYEIRDEEPSVKCLSNSCADWRPWRDYRNSPFTRLEPRAVTAKAVLERVREVGVKVSGTRDENYIAIYDTWWNAVAAEFGVDAL